MSNFVEHLLTLIHLCDMREEKKHTSHIGSVNISVGSSSPVYFTLEQWPAVVVTCQCLLWQIKRDNTIFSLYNTASTDTWPVQPPRRLSDVGSAASARQGAVLTNNGGTADGGGRRLLCTTFIFKKIKKKNKYVGCWYCLMRTPVSYYSI